MTPDIDLDRMRLPPVMTAPPPGRPPRHRQGEKFLKGPVPWAWLESAMRLPGKALHVALALWWEAGCANRRTVRFCLNGSLPGGLTRQSARRGLRRLAAGGLVTIRHLPGRGLEVTLSETPSPPPDRVYPRPPNR
jgi:hypothetical protein